MVKIGIFDVDEKQYPELDLKAYMQCQSTAFVGAMLSFVAGGGAGFIATQFVPKVYPKYLKKYNILVMSGSAILASYFAAQHLTKQCQRKFFMSAAPNATTAVMERPYTQKRADLETLHERKPTGQKRAESEILHEGKRAGALSRT